MQNSGHAGHWDIVVVGGTQMDYIVRGPDLPSGGQTKQGDIFLETPGGKGANQAFAAAKLGAKVAFVASVGKDDRGTQILRSLQEVGVDTQYVSQDDRLPTGIAITMVDAHGKKQSYSVAGAN